MERVGFRLKIRTAKMDEYVRRHTEVWPELLAELEKTGWHNYSIFLDRKDGTLFGYFETPDLAAAQAGMLGKDVNTKWQSEMMEFFEDLEGTTPDQGFLKLEHIFFLA
ncbi:MAG: L-rhamnose mutarotase [Actinomycetes bacterium]|jgi:L-rhamnose mutarotase|nr:L-rhamnose mutarotase [Actinomycetota bacterium]